MFQKRDAAFVYQTIKVSTHGRAIVDPAGSRSYNPGLPRMPSVVHRVRSRDALTEEEYIICTPVVLGFCLGSKKWGGFAISRLLDLESMESAGLSRSGAGRKSQETGPPSDQAALSR